MLLWRSTHLLTKLSVMTVMIVACFWAQTAFAEKMTLGFVVTKWNTAVYESLFMDECPEGLSPSNLEIWHSTLSPNERRSLPVVPFTQLRSANLRGPNGEDVCVYPLSVVDPPLKTVEGKYSFGMDLDGNSNGEATPKTCKHETFTSLDGVPGVDNQMYRLMGCVEAWRSNGDTELNANAHRLSSGLGMILIEVTGVDDVRNDSSVKIGFYRGVDPFTLDSRGDVLPYSSYGIDSHNGIPRYGDIVPGKIVDGVVMTEAADVNLPFYGNYQYMNQQFRDMQLHMELTPDGKTATGTVAGYYEVDQIYSYVRGMLGAFPNRRRFSCPAIYVAAQHLADGHPDPETGECTTLSSGFKFSAVAAFINHPDVEEDIAEEDGAEEDVAMDGQSRQFQRITANQ